MAESPLHRFLNLLREGATQNSFVRLTLGASRGNDPALRKVVVRPVLLRGEIVWSFVFRYPTRDITKNHPVQDALAHCAELLGSMLFRAHLRTRNAEATLDLRSAERPRLTLRALRETDSAPQTHDRQRDWRIGPDRGWLHGLGVTTREGRVCIGMEAKFRQINKFVELLSHLLPRTRLQPGTPLRLVDMGCGKGYLTFAAWDWLRSNGWPGAEVLGLETRPELVELCRRAAAAHSCEGLIFQHGTIADTQVLRAEVLVALHACDTATDDALAKGVGSGAALLMAAPCCHKELRSQLQPPAVLAGALRHGILHERQAELLTDALRAGLLEWAGYTTSVFEFIATEHTAKNLMIAAVQRGQTANRDQTAERVRQLAAWFGIRRQRLANELGLTLMAEAPNRAGSDPCE